MRGDLALMRLHVHALFIHASDGLMSRVNEPGGAAAPRFFFGRTAEGNVWRFRDDFPTAPMRALEALGDGQRVSSDLGPDPHTTATFSRVLADHAPIQSVWTGPTYRVHADLPAASNAVLVTEKDAQVLRPHFTDWFDDPPLCQPFLAVLRDGVAVSVCCSVRITPEAHEAGVETAPGYRGSGYAAQAVASWADAVHRSGRVALYSTSWENKASQAVAKKLGLAQFGADLHIT